MSLFIPERTEGSFKMEFGTNLKAAQAECPVLHLDPTPTNPAKNPHAKRPRQTHRPIVNPYAKRTQPKTECEPTPMDFVTPYEDATEVIELPAYKLHTTAELP